MPMSLMKCSTKKPGSKLRSMMRGPRLFSDQLAAPPAPTDCNTVFRSSPAFQPYSSASHTPIMFAAMRIWFTIFVCWPAPAPP